MLQVSGWQERAPRSISRDYDAFNSNLVIPVGDPGSEQKSHDAKVTSRTGATDANIAQNSYNNIVLAARTSKPAGTRLSDVFISVKTTRNYHKWRLPVILKTWFQLAKDQVRIITLLICASTASTQWHACLVFVTWLHNLLVFVFLCGIFYDAVGVYLRSSDRMNNWKGFRRKRSWRERDSSPTLPWRDSGKPIKLSPSVACDLTDIWSRHLSG